MTEYVQIVSVHLGTCLVVRARTVIKWRFIFWCFGVWNCVVW